MSDREFHFDGTLFFNTYAQCSLSVQELHDALQAIRPLKWIRICVERHQDGNPHLHTVGCFSSRLQSRNPRIFDVSGFHPNIQRPRCAAHCLKYVAKHSEFTDFGPVPTVGRGKRSARELFEAAPHLSEPEYWLQAAESGVNFQYAKKFRDLQFKDPKLEVAEGYIGNLDWESEFLRQLEPASTTVLVGPTGHGKTSWAKRVIPKPALIVSQIEDLRGFVAGYHKGIIFDDMCFDHTPVTSQIHLLDWDQPRSIFCRYSNAFIPANTPKIFTCNRFPFTMGDAAIMRRINLYVDLEFSVVSRSNTTTSASA